MPFLFFGALALLALARWGTANDQFEKRQREQESYRAAVSELEDALAQAEDRLAELKKALGKKDVQVRAALANVMWLRGRLELLEQNPVSVN